LSLYLRVIDSTDIEMILSFEEKKLSETIGDPMEQKFASWNAKWRRESLEHYVPLGWSFLAKDKDTISSDPEGTFVGYILCQPLIFLDGQTQTLWVEHLQYSSLQARDELCDLAVRLSKEKHFQKVVFPAGGSVANAIKSYGPQVWTPQMLQVKTTRT
jgi:hypothetical protein